MPRIIAKICRLCHHSPMRISPVRSTVFSFLSAWRNVVLLLYTFLIVSKHVSPKMREFKLHYALWIAAFLCGILLNMYYRNYKSAEWVARYKLMIEQI